MISSNLYLKETAEADSIGKCSPYIFGMIGSESCGVFLLGISVSGTEEVSLGLYIIHLT